MSFHALKAPLERALAARAYADPTPVQLAVIEERAAGRDLLVSAQTGSGKTVAFGLALAPTLLGEDDAFGRAAEPLALVIAPTRELAMQVQRELSWLYAETGARIASCVGGMDPKVERIALQGGAHIVVGTPGRLRDHMERRRLDVSKLKAVVLDEADEMLDLGFRDDLQFILDQTPPERRTLMFSATVPRGIESLARSYQKDALRIETARRNRQHDDIEYRAIRAPAYAAEAVVVNLLRFYDAPAALVFCATREGVRRMHTALAKRGFTAVALSGELSQSERTDALQSLRDGRSKVLVATDVAARGLDLAELSLVIHADLPNDVETLLHRSGRTGRAGRKGVSVLIVPPSRRKRAQEFLSRSRINADWAPAPTDREVAEKDRERLLALPILDELATAEDLALGRELLDGRSPEQVAAALVRMYRATLPVAENIKDSVRPAPRDDTRKPTFDRAGDGQDYGRNYEGERTDRRSNRTDSWKSDRAERESPQRSERQRPQRDLARDQDRPRRDDREWDRRLVTDAQEVDLETTADMAHRPQAQQPAEAVTPSTPASASSRANEPGAEEGSPRTEAVETPAAPLAGLPAMHSTAAASEPASLAPDVEGSPAADTEAATIVTLSPLPPVVNADAAAAAASRQTPPSIADADSRRDGAPARDPAKRTAPRPQRDSERAAKRGDDGPPRAGRRDDNADTVWFGVSIGRDKNADPRWLLPLICRAGDVTKAEIGSIRVQDTETRFEILAEHADNFETALKSSRHKEGRFWRIGDEPVAADAAAGARRPPARFDRDRSKSEGRPFKSRDGESGGNRPYQKSEGRPYKSRDGESGGNRPYQKSEGRPFKPRDSERGGDRPYQKSEGRPFKPREGERAGDRPYQKSEGRPFKPREGERAGDRPYQKSEGRPYKSRDGDRGGNSPYQQTEGRSFKPRDADRKDDRPRSSAGRDFKRDGAKSFDAKRPFDPDRKKSFDRPAFGKPAFGKSGDRKPFGKPGHSEKAYSKKPYVKSDRHSASRPDGASGGDRPAKRPWKAKEPS